MLLIPGKKWPKIYLHYKKKKAENRGVCLDGRCYCNEFGNSGTPKETFGLAVFSRSIFRALILVSKFKPLIGVGQQSRVDYLLESETECPRERSERNNYRMLALLSLREDAFFCHDAAGNPGPAVEWLSALCQDM